MKRNFLWFHEEPDDNGGGAVDLLEAPTDDVTPAEGAAETPTPEAKPPAFDPTTFATQFGETFAKTFKETNPTPEAKPKDLSPEEATKLLNVWQPDDAWYAKYDNLDTRKDAVKEQRDALIRQADTIAQIRMQQMREELMKEFSPIRDTLQRQEAAAQETRFGSAYPQLAKAELKPLISAVTQSLLSEGKRFATEAEAFTAVASRVESVMKATSPDFKLSAPAARSKSDGGIPVTTPGAGGGGGGGTKSVPTKGASRALGILGPVGGE